MDIDRIITTIRNTALGIVGLYIAALWFFGGIIGAIVAAFNGHLLWLLACLFIPAVGAIYTVVMTFAAIF